MLSLIVTYLATGVAFAMLDAGWLVLVGPRLYRPTLDSLLAERPRLPVAAVFYVLYIAGVVALAVWPGRDHSLGQTALRGAILGAMAYGTYDLTNQATMKVWSMRITLADIAWGAFATGASAWAGAVAWRWINLLF